MSTKLSSTNTPENDYSVSHEGISTFYADLVFGPKAQSKYLSTAAQNAISQAASHGQPISRETADEVAAGMQAWALDLGATHYTHWFQPLRGTTAEKHDSFFEPTGIDTGIEKFGGKALAQQEPDASSFPSGGIRNTFEARGYTAWDPSSPAFIMPKAGAKTLCIPTVFVSYTGEALDYKAPLLKSVAFLKQTATDVCQYFDKNVTTCSISLGIEQEYFLVDEQQFKSRPDLMFAGRTLIGNSPAKGQQLEDHYFGSIPNRVLAFMADFEERAHLLGIPLRTRHNEVAPAQFECAPQYEDMNLAVDHNSLLMDLMESVALDHNLRVLLHEKPYKGINGSGKHNNWSIITDTGVNLLAPGNSPESNLQFLTFFVNTIKAVHDHRDLLRASIATAANDHRLGANEAPPAIMSVFVGHTLENVLNDFESDAKVGTKANASATINVPNIPEILFDNTDRNRTSPFAFTGNKFEFRAVGSSDNCSSSMVVLNTIMANQLKNFKAEVDARMVEQNVTAEEAIKQILRTYITDTKRILFGGNGYGDEWKEEAKRRGLSNITTTPEALQAYLTPEAEKLFVENGIFSHRELEARTEIRYETYVLRLQIEGRVMNELVSSYVIPAAVNYQKRLADNINALKGMGLAASAYKAQAEIVEFLSKHINRVYELNEQMTSERAKANNLEHADKKALAYCNNVKPMFDEIRECCDEIERVCDDAEWTLPKYRELLSLS
ncbi:MAG: glutamine synthetase III [Bacteroidia bacterium]|nr:glutamine synthetase III [Bacteroidia bacterium]